jgi:Xaa-Pro aminopeptidase
MYAIVILDYNRCFPKNQALGTRFTGALPWLPMAVQIKSPHEIEKMRKAGRLCAEELEFIEPHNKPGITTGEIDRLRQE